VMAATGGQNHADQAQRILAEVLEQPRPISNSALRTHTPWTSFFCANFHACTLKEKGAGEKSVKARRPLPVLYLPGQEHQQRHFNYFRVAR